MHSVPPILADQLQMAYILLLLPLLFSARSLAQPLTTSSSQSQQREQRALHGRWGGGGGNCGGTEDNEKEMSGRREVEEGGRWRDE